MMVINIWIIFLLIIAAKFLYELLKKIFEAKTLNNGIIIIHRHKNENDEFHKLLNIIEEKSYGISKIMFGKFF